MKILRKIMLIMVAFLLLLSFIGCSEETINYTVTYDSQGAETEASPSSVEVADGETVQTLPTVPVKAGYLFGGWFTAINGGGTEFTANTMITVDMTLYAKWTAVFTVTYLGNGNTGGSVPVDSNSYTAGQAVTALNNLGSLIKPGAAFDNWNTQAGGSGTTYTADQVFLMGSANLTLYAQWSTTFFAVSFNGQGADTEASPISMNIATGNTVGSLPTPPQKTGYIFRGWFTAVNGGGTVFTTSTSIFANLTVYAKWTATYTISYDSQFADISAASPSVMNFIAGEKIGIFPTIPQKTDFSFGGWFTESSGNGVEITTNTIITANLTVYAKWLPRFVLYFNSQGATTVANPTSIVVVDGTTVSALPAAPIKTGFVFGGWFAEVNGGGTEFTISTVVNSEITVYAKWIEVFTVSYDSRSADTPSNPTSASIIDGTTVSALPTIPVKTGCIFDGWFTEVAGGGVEFSTNTVIINDMTVYAKWVIVYVAGREHSGSYNVAKYWRGGVAVNLTDGTQDAYAMAMQVVGSDVYVAGKEYNGTKNVAKYWKNGVAVDLTDGTKDVLTRAIQVVGSDVYVAGGESNGTKHVAKYWKNGVAVDLTDGTKYADAMAIQVVGSDVYVVGYEINASGKSVAKYWKNGVAVDLTDGTEFAHAFAIQVVGSDVFVAGKDGSVAKYWKNGVAVDLTDGTEIANANAIQVVGSDVYVVGYEINASGNFVAKYWKNGVAVDLTDGTKDAQTYAIQVVGSDVYVAGSERNSSSQYVAKYWKNGVAVDLTDGTQAAYADAMQVVVE